MPKKTHPKIKPQLEYNCSHCSSTFPAKRYRKPGMPRYCSDKCRNAANNKAKAPKLSKTEKYWQRFKETPLGLWMLSQCKRSGSVQTFQGASADDLRNLAALHAYRKRRYGWVGEGHGKDKFPMCHVKPLTPEDKQSIGLSYGANIFVGLREENAEQKNKPVCSWAGRSIPKAALLRRYDVDESMPRETVFRKLRNLLGKELDTYLSSLAKMPDRTKHIALAHRIYNRIGTNREIEPLDRSYSLDELLSLDFETLEELDAYHQGKTLDRSTRYLNCPPDSDLGVLYDELKRFSEVLPAGKQKENCTAMLPLIHVLGLWLAQTNTSEAQTRPRFQVPNAEWTPIQYIDWQFPWKPKLPYVQPPLEVRMVQDDQKMLRDTLLKGAWDALQGNSVPVDLLRARLRKRLDIAQLVPMPTVDHYGNDADFGDRARQFTALLQYLRPHLQLLEATGLCSSADVADTPKTLAKNMRLAVESARKRFAADYDSPLWSHKRWDGTYPEYLAIPTTQELLAAIGMDAIEPPVAA
ncbi:hypothetical protein [Pseudomonas panipatensis]|uniref:hypothetical protein n=1 Tax=Pseudomonas panipatensis TaxID=428992 RepID=UPI0035B03734